MLSLCSTPEITACGSVTPQSWRYEMPCGKGTLLLGNAGRIPVDYHFASDCDDLRVGSLLFDVAMIDAAAFAGRVMLLCEGGVALVLAVVSIGDQRLEVIGRRVLAFQEQRPSNSFSANGADDGDAQDDFTSNYEAHRGSAVYPCRAAFGVCDNPYSTWAGPFRARPFSFQCLAASSAA